MAERLSPVIKGKEFLLANNVPKELLGYIDNNGLQPDYLNHSVGWIMIVDSKYNPKKATNRLTDPDAKEEIREYLQTMPTYTEYWRHRIEQYNKARNKTDTTVEIDGTLQLITQAHPAIETLDVLTQMARTLAKKKSTTAEQLVIGGVIIAANIQGIFKGIKAQQKLQRDFGIQPRR